MAKINIRKAKEKDIARVVEIYEKFLDYEIENGTHSNWVKGLYPTEKNAKNGLAAGTLYVGELEGMIIGSYIINHAQPKEYNKLQWQYKGEGDEVIVIHTMCMDVYQQGSGYGRQFVEFAMEYGRKQGCTTMRLDTADINTPAAKLYYKMGFHYVGKTDFFFEQAIPEDLICFEYKLDGPMEFDKEDNLNRLMEDIGSLESGKTPREKTNADKTQSLKSEKGN